MLATLFLRLESASMTNEFSVMDYLIITPLPIKSGYTCSSVNSIT